MDENNGDLGEASAPSLSERRLEERAIRERWPISDEMRRRILERLCKVIEKDDDDDRYAVAAAKTIIAADKLNLEQAKFDHATKPPEKAADDFIIDLSDDDAPTEDHPALEGDPTPA